jgi:hypothetical protein
MNTKSNISESALITIDVQNDFSLTGMLAAKIPGAHDVPVKVSFLVKCLFLFHFRRVFQKTMP